MDAVEVDENFLVEAGKLLIEADDAVAFGSGAFFLVRTAGAIFALIKLLRSAIEFALDRYGAQKKEFPAVWADEIALFIQHEVHCPVGIIAVL